MRVATQRAPFVLSALLVILVFSMCCGGSSPMMQNQFCDGCQFVFATTNSGKIVTFQVSSTGRLSALSSVSGPLNSTGLITLIPSQLPLDVSVCVSDPQADSIRIYGVSGGNGSLSPDPIQTIPLGQGIGAPGEMVTFGNGFSSVTYVATSAGSIAALGFNMQGTLEIVSGSPFAAGTGVSHLVVAPSVAVANTTFLYAADTGDANGSISAFTIGAGGQLTPVSGSPFATVSGGAPEGFYDGGNFLYVALKNANAVAAFAIANDGSLSPLAGSPYPAGRGTFSLAGADGFLFATNNTDGTISSYSIDPLTGVLTQVQGSPFPAVAASGDSLYLNGTLYVPNASSNSINGFVPDLSNGTINRLNGSPFRVGAEPLALTVGGFVGQGPVSPGAIPARW